MTARRLNTSYDFAMPAADVLHRVWRVLNKVVHRMRHEPVRERWANLINRLNAEESAKRIKPPLKVTGAHAGLLGTTFRGSRL